MQYKYRCYSSLPDENMKQHGGSFIRSLLCVGRMGRSGHSYHGRLGCERLFGACLYNGVLQVRAFSREHRVDPLNVHCLAPEPACGHCGVFQRTTFRRSATCVGFTEEERMILILFLQCYFRLRTGVRDSCRVFQAPFIDRVR